MRICFWSLSLLALLGGCAGERSAPGPESAGPLAPGTGIPSFTTRAITGPDKGKALCYI